MPIQERIIDGHAVKFDTDLGGAVSEIDPTPAPNVVVKPANTSSAPGAPAPRTSPAAVSPGANLSAGLGSSAAPPSDSSPSRTVISDAPTAEG